jgi:hypothetical protein
MCIRDSGIRIISNPHHYSAAKWYQDQKFKGSPQSTIVDGYEAVRDGRTVYADVSNVQGDTLFTNIYLISYNQSAEKETVDIFGQILSHWKFNSNITGSGHCRKSAATDCVKDDECSLGDFCDSPKARIIRDVNRLSGLSDVKAKLASYNKAHTFYPKLSSGSYLPGRTISVWPSWSGQLGKDLGGKLPVDPVNVIGTCPGYDSKTCWNNETKRFITNLPDLPPNSLVFSYSSVGGTVCAIFESGLTIYTASPADAVCSLPVCLDFDGEVTAIPLLLVALIKTKRIVTILILMLV